MQVELSENQAMFLEYIQKPECFNLKEKVYFSAKLLLATLLLQEGWAALKFAKIK
ncbi:hypothetical protein [Pedobacter sp.]|uniref:hypothetical protein n=1 Tax=Pedobacter sp. TaxID=1411316 RepID=UPI00396C8F09